MRLRNGVAENLSISTVDILYLAAAIRGVSAAVEACTNRDSIPTEETALSIANDLGFAARLLADLNAEIAGYVSDPVAFAKATSDEPEPVTIPHDLALAAIRITSWVDATRAAGRDVLPPGVTSEHLGRLYRCLEGQGVIEGDAA